MDNILFTVSRAFGLVPLQTTDKDSFTKFSLMVLFPFMYFCTYCFTYMLSRDFQYIVQCPSICSLSHFMYLHMGAFVYWAAYLLSVSKGRFYSTFERKLSQIDEDLRKCESKSPVSKVSRRKFYLAIAITGTVLFLTGGLFDAYNLYQLIDYNFAMMCFTNLFPFLAASLVQSQFITLTYSIAIRFEEVNKILETISHECESEDSLDEKSFDSPKKQSKPAPSAEKTRNALRSSSKAEKYFVNIFNLHDDLCALSVILNDSYTLQTVSFMTATFITMVYGIFLGTKVIFLVRGMNKYLDYIACSYVIWGTTFCLLAYMVLRLCVRVQREWKRSALLVHEIMQKKPAFMLGNDIFYNRMKCFTLQFLHWQRYFRFNGIGLFDLDYTFIFSAISSATSYLIVLLQFDLSAELV